MKNNSNRKNNIFKNYFIMYFLVLLIPMVICCIYYVYMFYVINSDDIEARSKDLMHSAVRLDTLVSEIHYLGDCLVANEEVNRFKTCENVMEYPNTYKVYELREALPDLYLVNQAVDDYYIFFDHSETVLNKSIAYSYEQFYQLYLAPVKTDTYEIWKEEFFKKNDQQGFWPMELYHRWVDKTEEELIAYTRPLIAKGIHETGHIFIYLKKATIDAMMPTMEEGSIQTIHNFSGDLIYHQEDGEYEALEEELNAFFDDFDVTEGIQQMSVKFNDRSYTLITYLSASSGMRYSFFVPSAVVNARMMYCILMLILFVAIGILADVALSYHISMKTATPINDILNQMSLKIEKFEGHQSAFASLQNTFNYLAESNADLSNALNMQKPYLKTAFVNRLLFSGFQNEKDIQGMAEYLGCPLTNRAFCVLVFRIHMVTEAIEERHQRLLNSFSASMTELIDQKLPGSLYTDLGEGQLALVMNTEMNTEKQIKAQAEDLVAYIRREMAPSIAQKVFVYGGSIESLPGKIHESYQNAAYLCYREAEQIENTIIWYDKECNHSIGYPSDDMQVKLVHYVTSGDEEGLHDYLEGIVTEFFIEADLPVYLQHMLITDLQSTLFRLLGLVKLEDHEYANYYNQLEQNHNMPVLYQIRITLNLYKDLCQSMNKQKKMQDADMVAGGIVAYIDSHYGDPNLSLAMVADQFQISQPYLSSLFKQTQGINFSTYIENIRIDKAKDFLRTTDLPIVKISEMVGYGSTNSFCRAFKRVTGLNTSEYRKD